MSYLSIDVNCQEDYIEIFMAELAALGFATFQEKEDGSGLLAFAEEDQSVNRQEIEQLFKQYKDLTSASFDLGSVEKENWNVDWEKNYQPIEVEDKILVRANFHPSNQKFPLEIIVTPKMSFGTGHHETTYQMLNLMDSMNLEGESVLDAGCGTGILAILAGLKGARVVDAYDIDEWAVENTKENFSLNPLDNAATNVWRGSVDSIPAKNSYDVVLANINKNILLSDIKHLQKHMKSGAYLMLSGFYVTDKEDLLKECEKFSLKLENESERNLWSALLLRRYI